MAHLYFRGMALAPSVLVTAQDYRLMPEAGPRYQLYAASGVEELWLADPVTKTVEVYLLQKNAEQPAMINRNNDIFQSPTFPGLQIALSEIFKA